MWWSVGLIILMSIRWANTNRRLVRHYKRVCIFIIFLSFIFELRCSGGGYLNIHNIFNPRFLLAYPKQVPVFREFWWVSFLLLPLRNVLIIFFNLFLLFKYFALTFYFRNIKFFLCLYTVFIVLKCYDYFDLYWNKAGSGLKDLSFF